jgi:hypothetical protein
LAQNGELTYHVRVYFIQSREKVGERGIFTGEGTKAKFFMSFKKITPPKFPVDSVGWLGERKMTFEREPGRFK